MEIVLAAVVAAVVAAAVVSLMTRRGTRPAPVALGPPPPRTVEAPPRTAVRRRDEKAEPDLEPDTELDARRAELARIEERLLSKQEALDLQLAEVGRKERSLDDRARNLEREAERLKDSMHDHVRELERVAGLSAGQARQILLKELEDALRHDSARLIRQVEEEAKREADRRARNILATCLQRMAAGHAVETTVSVVALQSDDLKGRIIGREGPKTGPPRPSTGSTLSSTTRPVP